MVSKFFRDERLRDSRARLAIGIVLVILLFFWQAVIVQGVFFLGDTSHGYFPRLVFTANALRDGRLPLWNPLVSLGGPHLADPAALALYPPAWMLFVALPSVAAYDYLILLHLALAAIFTFLFMRRIGVGAYGAIFSALLFPFSGWMLTHYEHINVFIGALYVPILFWIVEVAFQENLSSTVISSGARNLAVAKQDFSQEPLEMTSNRLHKTSWRWFVISALLIGFYFLGAHAQMPLFASVGLVIYALGRALFAWREGSSGKKIAWTFAQLAALGILGVGLAAIQLVPTAQTVALSNRSSGVGADVALGYSLPPEQVLTLVAPYVFGSPMGVAYWGRGAFREMTTYLGILPLLFAIVGIWSARKNKYALLLSMLALVAWLLALGRFTPLYGVLANLPLFNAVRYPPRFLFLVSFALIALAGIGLERALAMNWNARRVKFVLATCGIAAIFFAVLNLLFIQHSFLNGMVATILNVYGRAQHPAAFYLERLEFGLSWGGVSGFALALFGVSALLWIGLFGARKISGKWFAFGAIALGVLDLWVFNWSLPYNRLTNPRLYTEPSANATILMQDTSYFRLYYFDHDNTAATNLVQKHLQQGNFENYQERLREGLRGSFNTLFSIPGITGYATEEQRHYDVMRALGGLPAYDLVSDDEYQDALNTNLLSLLNGKYVTSLEDLNVEGLTLLHRGALVNLYRNENVLPRAFIPARYEIAADAKTVLEKLTAQNFDPRATVLLEQAPRIPEPSASAGQTARGHVEIASYASEQVELDVTLETPGVVVLSDTFYPGWRVEVDGAPAEILRADYILRGVALGAGSHRVRFYYAPDAVRWGAWISGVSAGILGLIALLGWRRAKILYRSPIPRGY